MEKVMSMKEISEEELIEQIGETGRTGLVAERELQRRYSKRMTDSAENQAEYARTVRTFTVVIGVAAVLNVLSTLLVLVIGK